MIAARLDRLARECEIHPPTPSQAKRPWRRNRRTREDALKADVTWADPAALCKQSYHSAGLIMRSTAHSGNPQTANTSLGFNYCRGMPLTLISAFRLSARSAADAFLSLATASSILTSPSSDCPASCTPKALDDSRYYCPSVRQASVLLETWMVAARHNLLHIELSAVPGVSCVLQ
jgi:hypothetical protein